MIRSLLLLLLAGAATLTADTLTVECVTETCVVWYMDGGALGNAHLDISASTDFTTHNETPDRPYGSGVRFSGQVTLAPGTWYLRVHSATQGIIDCSAVTTFSGDGTCTSTVIQVTTTAGASGGLSPTFTFDLQTWRKNVCEGTATATYTVDSSGSGCRANFDTAISSAVTAWELDTDTVQVIRIDPATCQEGVLGTGNESTHFEFPDMLDDDTALGGIRIETLAADGVLPPHGVRIDPTYQDSIVKFGPAKNLRYFGETATNQEVWKIANATNGGGQIAHHLCFKAMEIGRPDPGEVFYSRPITGASGSTLTIGGGGLPDGHHNGTHFVVECDTDTGGWSGPAGCGGTCTAASSSLPLNKTPDDASCTSGTVYWAPTGAEIATVSTAGVLTLAGGLPIPWLNYPDMPIDSVTAGTGDSTIVLNAAMPTPSGVRVLAVGDVLYFQSTGTSLDASPVVVASITSDTEFVVSTQADTNCVTDCGGTVRLMKPFVLGFTSDASLEGAHYGLKLTSTTAQLLDPTDFSNLSLGAASTGGWFSYEPYTARGFIASWGENDAVNIAMDQILFNPLAFPSRDSGEPVTGSVWQNPDNVSIVNSYSLPQEAWEYKDPVTGAFVSYQGNNSAIPTTQFFRTSAILKWEFNNNSISASHGIIIGEDSGMTPPAGTVAVGHDFLRNDFHMPDRWLSPRDATMGPNLLWAGLAHDNRHVFEIKSGCQARVVGNSVYRNFGTAAGSVTQPFAFKSGGADTSDLTRGNCAGSFLVAGNVFVRTGGMMFFGGISAAGNIGMYGPVEVAYNWYGGDSRTLYVDPNFGGGSNFGGVAVRMVDGAVGAYIHHNTQAYGIHQNVPGEFLGFGWQLGRAVIERNIILDQDTGAGSSIWGNADGNLGWGSVNCTAPYLACAASTPDGDGTNTIHPDSKWADNVVRPGLKDANQQFAAWVLDMASSTLGTDYKGYSDTNTEWGSSEVNGTANLIPCNGDATYNDCTDSIFGANNGWDPAGAYNGYGAEPAEIKKRRGTWTLTPTLLSATSFKVDFDNPVAAEDLTTVLPCYVDYSTDPTMNTGVTRVNAGTDGTETISGLANSTTYYVRVSCVDAGPGKYIRPITTGS